MSKKIITISREFGSGGRTIGRQVAEKLGVSFYDKELIEQVAAKSGLAENLLKSRENILRRRIALHTRLWGVASMECLWMTISGQYNGKSFWRLRKENPALSWDVARTTFCGIERMS